MDGLASAFGTLLAAAGLATSPGATDLWITEQADPQLWKEVRVVLEKELLPEDPAATAPYQAQKFKYVSRIGCLSDLCVVLIGERPEPTDPPGDDYFMAYNFRRSTRQASQLGSHGFRILEFVTWVHMDSAKASDAVFSHQSCSECEAAYLLSVFYVDSAAGRWALRRWPGEDGDSLMIGSDLQFGDDDDWETECLHQIADFDGDGHTDVAIWCQTQGVSTHKREEWLNLYGVKNGRAVETSPKGTSAKRIRASLCRQRPTSALCQ